MKFRKSCRSIALLSIGSMLFSLARGNVRPAGAQSSRFHLEEATIADLHAEYDEQLRSLGVGPWRTIATLLWDGRFSLLTAVLAGFGRASAEVGAVIIVAMDDAAAMAIGSMAKRAYG